MRLPSLKFVWLFARKLRHISCMSTVWPVTFSIDLLTLKSVHSSWHEKTSRLYWTFPIAFHSRGSCKSRNREMNRGCSRLCKYGVLETGRAERKKEWWWSLTGLCDLSRSHDVPLAAVTGAAWQLRGRCCSVITKNILFYRGTVVVNVALWTSRVVETLPMFREAGDVQSGVDIPATATRHTLGHFGDEVSPGSWLQRYWHAAKLTQTNMHNN